MKVAVFNPARHAPMIDLNSRHNEFATSLSPVCGKDQWVESITSLPCFQQRDFFSFPAESMIGKE